MQNKRNCMNCLKGKLIPVLGDILCYEQGIVTPAYSCSKHKYNHMLQLREEKEKCIHCGHFIPSSPQQGSNISTGTCGFFSTRQFNGRERNVCSKYQSRDESILLHA